MIEANGESMIYAILIDNQDRIWMGDLAGYLYKYHLNGTRLNRWLITATGMGYTEPSVRGQLDFDSSWNIRMIIGSRHMTAGWTAYLMFDTTAETFTLLRSASQMQADLGRTDAISPISTVVDRVRGYVYGAFDRAYQMKAFRYNLDGTGFTWLAETSPARGSSTQWWVCRGVICSVPFLPLPSRYQRYSLAIDRSNGDIHAQYLDFGSSAYDYKLIKWTAGGTSTPVQLTANFPQMNAWQKIIGGDRYYNSRSSVSPLTDYVPSNRTYLFTSFDTLSDFYPLGYPYDTFIGRYQDGVYKIKLDSSVLGGAVETKLPVTGLSTDAGLARSSSGDYYAVVGGGTTIIKINGATYATSSFASGFTAITRIVAGPTGDVFVLDGNSVKRVTSGGTISTIASGFSLNNGVADGDGTKPTYALFGLGVDSGNNVFVSTVGYVSCFTRFTQKLPSDFRLLLHQRQFNALAGGTSEITPKILRFAATTWTQSTFVDLGTTTRAGLGYYYDSQYTTLYGYYPAVNIAVDGEWMLIAGYKSIPPPTSNDQEMFDAASTKTTTWSPTVLGTNLRMDAYGLMSPIAVLGATGYLHYYTMAGECLK